MKIIHIHSLLFAFLFTSVVFSQNTFARSDVTPEGVIAVTIDQMAKRSHRAALVIGEVGNGLSASIALVARDALYSSDLELAGAVGVDDNAETLPGQILEANPAKIEYRADARQLYLAAVLLRRGRPATAACHSQIQSGDTSSIFTWAEAPESIVRLSGRIDRIENYGFTMKLQGQARPQPGDPVFITKKPRPEGATLLMGDAPAGKDLAVGLVANTLPYGVVQVVNLATVFRGLSPDAATWAIHPDAPCSNIPRKDGRLQQIDDVVAEFLKKEIELWALTRRPSNYTLRDIERKEILDGRPAWREILDTRDRNTLSNQFHDFLSAEWAIARDALMAPGVEQYYFNPDLPDRDRFVQFQISIANALTDKAQLQTELQAAGAIFKVRTKRGSAEPLAGWGIAIGQIDGDVAEQMGETVRILVVTARHLLDTGSDDPTETLVYPPSLQGVGLPAERTAFEDPSLDLVLLAVPANKEVAAAAFRATGISCSTSPSGAAEIPVRTWGWQRAALRGTLAAGPNPDRILINGMEVLPGLSGAALLQDKIYLAGIVVSNDGDHANGVTIQAAMRLLPPGTAALPLRPDCSPPTLEAAAVSAMRKQMFGEHAVRQATASDLRLLYGDTAVGIDLNKLAILPTEWREEPAGLLPAMLNGQMEGYCATLLPVRTPVDGKQSTCDVDRWDQAKSRRLNPRAPLPICRVVIRYSRTNYSGKPEASYSVTTPIAFTNGTFWYTSPFWACNGARIGWYVPTNWLSEQAALAPPMSTVVVQGGKQHMGACVEIEIPALKLPGGYNLNPVECSTDSSTSSFDVNVATFEIGRFPVMVSQYAKCVLDGKCHYEPPEPDIFHEGRFGRGQYKECNWGAVGRESHPMNCINWQQAQEYCQKNGGHLPTDVQWERAVYGFDAQADPYAYSVFYRWGTMETGHVPSFRSRSGLEDVIWHVSEWTGAEYKNYAGHVLARGPKGYRVIRGGQDGPYKRRAESETNEHHNLGFRCAYPLQHPLVRFAPAI